VADPYKVLGIGPDADEATLRRRYLELVRQYPPEKCPQQFAEIREAYDDARDPETRLQKLLFGANAEESLDDIVADVRVSVQSARIPTEVLLSMAEG
jgi:curved DNA-binding protein CbpA